MFSFLESLPATLIGLLEQGDPVVFGALFLISTVIEFGIPIPLVQDTILVFVGFESQHVLPTTLTIMGTLMAGRVTGGSCLFWIMYKFGPRFSGWLKRRFPRVWARSQNLGERLGKNTTLAVAVARLTPGILTPSTITAGLLRLRYMYFCFGIMLASLVPDTAEVLYGLAIRKGITFLGATPSPTLLIITLVSVFLLIWLTTWLWRRHRRKGKD